MSTEEHTLPVIGISCGDLNGIGLEIILKTFADSRMCELCTPIIFASAKVVSYHRKACNLMQLHYQQIRKPEEAHQGKINVCHSWDDDVNIELGQIDAVVGKFAIRSLKAAIAAFDAGLVDAIVTAPIHKSASYNEQDFPFSGHTGYFAHHYKEDALMLLCEGDFRVALLTDHIPLANVSETITPEGVEKFIRRLTDSLIQDFSIQRPKIAVLGVNPHAGDEGLIGDEDQKILVPTIEKLRDEGMTVYGPFAADGFFGTGGQDKFDAIVAMYHDQGLAPFKALSFGNGVNITLGLPLIRTSPDHGTGFDIAGQDQANENSFRQAVYLALEVYKNRNLNQKLKGNALQPQHKPRRGDR